MAGAQVHNLIRCAHHAGFVLDDHHRISGIAQPPKNSDKSFGVARVKANARLVQDEERVDQARSEAGGEVDALGFAARERAGRAVECKIAQTHLVEIAQARAHLTQDQAQWVVFTKGLRLSDCFDEGQGVADL